MLPTNSHEVKGAMATANDNTELIKRLAQAVDVAEHPSLVEEAADVVDDFSMEQSVTLRTDEYESDTFQNDIELLNTFYQEVRESFNVAMKAEDIDEDTREAVLKTVDDNV